MTKNIIYDKSYSFALRVVKLSNYLKNEHKEFVLSRQVLRSGTAIGALIKEAQFAQSKADFIHKLSIALKEANETDYWINILYDSNYLNKKMYDSLTVDVKEIISLLVSIVKSSKNNS